MFILKSVLIILETFWQENRIISTVKSYWKFPKKSETVTENFVSKNVFFVIIVFFFWIATRVIVIRFIWNYCVYSYNSYNSYYSYSYSPLNSYKIHVTWVGVDLMGISLVNLSSIAEWLPVYPIVAWWYLNSCQHLMMIFYCLFFLSFIS